MIQLLSFLLSLLLVSTLGLAQNSIDYFDYHIQINEADSLLFILDKPEEGLNKYTSLFEQFDRIFTKDLINAQALSEHFQIENADFKKYLSKTHFSHSSDGFIPSLTTSTIALSDSVVRSRINFNIRNRILELCAYDQATKSYSFASFERKKLYDTLFSIINREGFPSEFLVGLDDPFLTTRARTPHRSLEKYWKAIHLPKPKKQILKEESEIIGFKAINLILIHNPCAYDRLSQIIIQEIAIGNLHPGEAAIYYDNLFRFPKVVHSDCPDSFDSSIYFDHNSFAKPPSDFDKDKTNIARHAIGLPSVKLEDAKRAFSTSTGVQLFWGFWGAT